MNSAALSLPPAARWPKPASTNGGRGLAGLSALNPQQRLLALLLVVLAGVFLVVARLAWVAVAAERDPRMATRVAGAQRADITDRNGLVLARTIDAWSIGIHPARRLNSARTLAERLNALMPERSVAQYLDILNSGRSFTYLRRRAQPDLVAQVNAIGEPAIAFAREPERLYPQGLLAAHVLGYTDAEGRGAFGMERVLDETLGNTGGDARPIALSIDARVQSILEAELSATMADQQALGATGLILDAATGEIIALASLPVYNPNRPGRAGVEALRNNVTQSVYELGSTFKPLTIANGIETGVIPSLAQRYDATAPLRVGGFTIRDDHPAGRWLNVPEMLALSSNIVTAQIAEQIGRARTETMYRALGFDQPPTIELREKGRPIWPTYWGRTTVMTIGYGHGMAVTPLHLATAYAALVNGGVWRPATLLKRDRPTDGRRVFSEETSRRMRQMLRTIVTHGTGGKANAPGLRVGGKTGTAEKPGGGTYVRHAVVSTFACAFPMDAPRYVVIAMLDQPKGSASTYGLRTAGWTVAPMTGRLITRIGPLLGVVPDLGREVDLTGVETLFQASKPGGH